jgi:hypothetical protein
MLKNRRAVKMAKQFEHTPNKVRGNYWILRLAFCAFLAVPVILSSLAIPTWGSAPNAQPTPLFPEQYGAVGNGVTDDTSAVLKCASAAFRSGRPIGFDRKYRLAVDTTTGATQITISSNAIFYSGSTIQPDQGLAVQLNALVTGPWTEKIFTGKGTVQTPNANWVSVAWWGAMVAEADAAVAFRQAIGSNRTIFVPRGTYVFRSTEATNIQQLVGACVMVRGAKNFKIYGYGATIQNTKQAATGGCLFFEFLGCSDFQVMGLQLNNTQKGNQNALANYDGFALFSVNRCRFTDLYFSGNWSAFNAAFEGDWIANGTFEKMKMDNLGIGFDFAYVNHCTFNNIVGYGTGSGPNCLGNCGISFIHDTTWYGTRTNYLGLPYLDTNDVTITNCSFTNLSTGYELLCGNDYHFSGNHWNSNPGTALLGGITPAGQPGYGGWIAWLILPGACNSSGYPPRDIHISGDTYNQNGTAVATDPALGYGAGIFISAATVDNTDVIGQISIDNTKFYNNDNCGINSDTSKHIQNISLSDPTFSGPQQTVAIGAHLLGIIYGKAQPFLQNATVQKSPPVVAGALRRQARLANATRNGN